jgi:catechol 2,3-dioxygenase-like lactoylglutathione lyase family enzyme
MGITDRSTKEPLLKTSRLGHGTLQCNDLAKTRRFYEEVLGIEVLQTGPRSLMIRKDTNHVYAVVETKKAGDGSALQGGTTMHLLNHNGLEVATPEDVDEAYEILSKLKDEWGLRVVQKPRHLHGDHAFYFLDFDGNWWEIVSVREGGYAADFNNGEPERDLTGHHEFDDADGDDVNHIHTHNPEFRKKFAEQLAGGVRATGN